MNNKGQQHIYERVYELIKRECQKENIDIEDLLTFILNERNIQYTQIKKVLIQELNNTIEKVKRLDINSQLEENSKNKAIRIVPLTNVNHRLPMEIGKIIKKNKECKVFDEKYFFLVTNENRIIGYFALSFHDEAPPFGEYLYIYTYKLDKAYENYNNQIYILNYIESVAKAKNLQNIDLTTRNNGFSKTLLSKRGYIIFNSTVTIRIRKGVNNDDLDLVNENGKISVEDLKTQYLPLDRISPVEELLNNKNLKIRKHRIKNNAIAKEVDIIILSHTNDNYIYLFVEPINLYDNSFFEDSIVDIIRYIISSYNNDFIIGVPEETLDSLKTINYEVIEKIEWYRKILTYIKN